MTEVGMRGKLCCQQVVEFDWKIENFSSSPETENHFYISPSFDFCGRSWYVRLFPKGRTQTKGFIGLFLNLVDSHRPLKIRYSLGIKDSSGETQVWLKDIRTFNHINYSWGDYRIILRSELLSRRDQLIPMDVLTLTVTLKIGKNRALKEDTKHVSVQTTLDDNIAEDLQKKGRGMVLQDMRRLWLSGDNSDVVIQVGDMKFKTHRAILGIRTPVLSAMFKHDTAEKNSGVVTIEDCEPDAFEQLLHCIYTGAPEILTAENASALYAVADKYLVGELKALCVCCLQDTLCSDSFCDVVTLSLVHKEEKLLEMAIDFFSKNMFDVMKTVKWQTFLREHSSWANDITIRAAEKIAARTEK